MKRRVKYYKRVKNGTVYRQPWVGYSYRNDNGTPDFKREFSLAGWEPPQVNAIDAALRHGAGPEAAPRIEFLDALPIGAPWTAWRIAEGLGIVGQLSCIDEKYRLPLLAMILDRVVQPLPHSKLALWETLPGSALERVIAPQGSAGRLHDFYNALEKIHEKQNDIQISLFSGRKTADRMFLYDIPSSYFEGCGCTLAEFGYNRDGKKGKMQIVIGLLTDSDGRPLAVEVFEGNTSDQTTVMGRIDSMRRQFGIEEMIFVGDRGMITRARRNDLQAEEYDKVKYVSALTRKEFFQFLEDQSHPIQPGIFDRHNLVEIEHDNIRYVLSFNPEKEAEDRATRLKLIARTREKLEIVQRNVDGGKWKRPDVIAKRIHRWVNNWRMERFFVYTYSEGRFAFELNHERIKEYEAIDGFYVLITDVVKDKLSTDEVCSRYKSLSQVEQAFRAMKTTDLFVRPIRHWNPGRVKGHVFVCMLAYLIVWKARELFAEFTTGNQISDDDNPEDACHSLRVIWERLNRWLQVGRLRIGGEIKEQLNSPPVEAKGVLSAANAMPVARHVDRLKLVG